MSVLPVGKHDLPLRQHGLLKIGQQIDFPVDSLRPVQQFDCPPDSKSQIARATRHSGFAESGNDLPFFPGRFDSALSGKKNKSGGIFLVQRVHEALRLPYSDFKGGSSAGNGALHRHGIVKDDHRFRSSPRQK